MSTTLTAEPRVAKIAADLVDSLKHVIRRHQVSVGEFGEAVGFVRSVVQDGELELLSAVLFEAVVDEANDADSGGTASNVEGPFYAAGAPLIAADDGPPRLPMRRGEPGEPLTFVGSVRGTGGEPLGSAMVDVWQADGEGQYSQFAPGIPQWNLRGRVRTDEKGRFAFRTVVPAAYDIPGLPHTARLLSMLGMPPHRPAHVHLKVSADGYRPLTTQVYFAGDPWLEEDVVGAAKPSLVTELRTDADIAGRRCTFEVVLAPASA